MENEENLDFELEEQTEETTEEVVVDEKDKELEEAKAEAAKYRRLFEKSQQKPKPEVKTTVEAPQNASVNVEETVLLANGMDENLLEQLKKVATIQGVSLIKAQADPIFVAIKDKFEKDLKEKSASLNVSRGSGAVKPKKDFKTPGLTEAERKEMFEARFNQ